MRLGRYVIQLRRRWPFVRWWKLPPMERVHWWTPDPYRKDRTGD